MQVDNLILKESIGKGAFGEVFLSNYIGKNIKYATKVYERDKIEKSKDLNRYLISEINILNKLKHPNIVKFIEAKKTKKHYYIVTEFCNGGDLQKALEQYMKKYGKPFSEEIVQYLMKQIISAFHYIHGKGILHRDIKLDNILIQFDNEEDKKNLNMMKAIPKIIDFGFAIRPKDGLANSLVGNPMNMDPLMLKKCTCKGKVRHLGYDMKTDIWSLGSICYEMLIGKFAFDSEDMDELVQKVETGDYSVPVSLSEEIVSFLNSMLQYKSEERTTCAQLINHKFLTKNINNFHKIPLTKVSHKIKGNELIINVKHNNTIWSIFNENDENKLLNIGTGENNLKRINSLNDAKIPNKQLSMEQPSLKHLQTFEIKENKNHEMVLNNINKNSGPILPKRDEQNPIYINQKFDVETNYVYSANIFGESK